jgi:hypothetical protein
VLRTVKSWKTEERWILPVSSRTGPGLAVLGSRLVLAYSRKDDDRLNILWSTDGGRTSTRESLVEWTRSRPCLHVHDGLVYLAWRGQEDRLCIRSSLNGSQPWSQAIVLRESSLDGPALASLGTELVWAWTAAKPRGRLSLLQYDTWQPEPEPLEA